MPDLTRQTSRSGRAFIAHDPPKPVKRGPGEPPLPGTLAMAKSYAASTVRHVRAGRPVTPPDLFAARLAACEACDHLRPSDRRCGVVAGKGCGCPVEIKAARLLEVCPADRWPVVTQSETGYTASHPPGTASGEMTGPASQDSTRTHGTRGSNASDA